jgi:hypothetical protein
MGGTEILGGDPIYGDLKSVRLASDRLGGPTMYGEEYTDEGSPFDAFKDLPEEGPEGMREIVKRGPHLIPQDVDKELKGDLQEPEAEGSDSSPILHHPSTSNIRSYIEREDGSGGYRTYGSKESDAFAKGFRRGEQAFYASPKVYDLMKKEGINPNDPMAMEFMKDLQKTKPQLFSNKNEFNNAINNMVMKEVGSDPVYGRGFFMPKQKIKASFLDGGKVYVR